MQKIRLTLHIKRGTWARTDRFRRFHLLLYEFIKVKLPIFMGNLPFASSPDNFYHRGVQNSGGSWKLFTICRDLRRKNAHNFLRNTALNRANKP